jgi:hypothetical protein
MMPAVDIFSENEFGKGGVERPVIDTTVYCGNLSSFRFTYYA